jgi:peptide/nickel transport system ATP-binding protein
MQESVLEQPVAVSPYTVVVNHLSVSFSQGRGEVRAVNDVSFRIPRGTSLGIVGESGSGKSTLGTALFDSVTRPGKIVAGEVLYGKGVNFLNLDAESQRRAFGAKIAMVFQGNQSSLNPLLRIRQQVEDIGRAHDYDRRLSEIRARAEALFTEMSLDPHRVMEAYPHELSGGMRQRVGIALALLLDPELIVLDEPTTALDVLSQAAVLRILARIKAEGRISFIFITHDISVVSQVVDRVAVMYAGRLVELGPVEAVMAKPWHPYAQGLIGSIPPLHGSLADVRPLAGQPPNLSLLPPGCPFVARCPERLPPCEGEPPPLVEAGDRSVLCHARTPEGVPT